MNQHEHARKLLQRIAVKSSRQLSAEQFERAVALLVDLWATATRHGITDKHWGWEINLPRAAYDVMASPLRSPERHKANRDRYRQAHQEGRHLT
jgi:hypothetical protein